MTCIRELHFPHTRRPLRRWREYADPPGPRSSTEITAEMVRLEGAAAHLVRFLRAGGESSIVRNELRGIEEKIVGLEAELAGAADRPQTIPKIHRGWVMATLERLLDLLQRDAVRAKAEIARHLDGELSITPLLSPAGERRAEVSGAVKSEGLLGGEEACRQQ